MKIIVETLNGATIEIDLEGQTLTASIPVVDVLGEIRVEDGTPPIVHLTLPFGLPVISPILEATDGQD